MSRPSGKETCAIPATRGVIEHYDSPEVTHSNTVRKGFGDRSATIGDLVERTTRFTMLIHLPCEEGYGIIPRTKNGPALAGYGAVTMADALAKTITTLPQQLRQSVTWDRGIELSDHTRFTVDTGVKVYVADPKCPWQRGTNENTNGLLEWSPKVGHRI